MPIVASMGGNAGTQSLTVAVRAIATNRCRPGLGLRCVCHDGDRRGGLLCFPRACRNVAIVMDLAARKDAARKSAFARRKAAHEAGQGTAGFLSEVLAGYRGVPLAGYMAMRSEIDPTAALEEASAHGPVGVPVILGAGQPLKFRAWTPDAVMVPGAFGAAM